MKGKRIQKTRPRRTARRDDSEPDLYSKANIAKMELTSVIMRKRQTTKQTIDTKNISSIIRDSLWRVSIS